MRPQAAHEVPLICVACRVVTAEARNLHTVAVETIFGKSAGTVACSPGSAGCVNPACNRRYPIVDGVAILAGDLAAFTLARDALAGLHEADLVPEVAALLALAGPDESAHARALEHVSIYMDAHWGDRATPAPDGPSPGGLATLAARLRDCPPVARLVELGTSVGRGLAEAARGARVAVGLDVSVGSLPRPRRMLAGETVRWARRTVGRHYSVASAQAGDLAHPGATWVCGDALDPPLAPLAFDRVLALNLVDAVPNPAQLLAVMDGLCAPGGEVILSSPYAWQSSHVVEGHRLGDADPAGEIARHFRAQGYQIVDEVDVPWSLRRDSRSAVTYSAHYLRARKSGG